MWNSDNPLKIYLTMSKEVTSEELKRLQDVIDEDKELDSRRNDRDVCGVYAPFCEYCDKNLTYACANAYIKMKQAEGVNIVEPEPEPEPTVEEAPAEVCQVEVAEVIDEEEQAEEVVDEEAVEEVVQVEQPPVQIEPKRVIKIAHIKRVK